MAPLASLSHTIVICFFNFSTSANCFKVTLAPCSFSLLASLDLSISVRLAYVISSHPNSSSAGGTLGEMYVVNMSVCCWFQLNLDFMRNIIISRVISNFFPTLLHCFIKFSTILL